LARGAAGGQHRKHNATTEAAIISARRRRGVAPAAIHGRVRPVNTAPPKSCNAPDSPAALPARSGRTEIMPAFVLAIVSPLPMPTQIVAANSTSGCDRPDQEQPRPAHSPE
jgi:hypothetical protein